MTTYYTTPHEAYETKKLDGMIEALRQGKSLPPIVVLGEVALTGSHRLAAWEACEMMPQVVEVSSEDYLAALDLLGMDEYDEIYDYSQFCDALYEVTSSREVKAALKDQR